MPATVRFLLFWLTLCALSSASFSASARPKPFDYYVMSLSWSPEFCTIRPEDRQCGRGYGLVLHGLWPQYTKGYPEKCSSQRLSSDLLRDFSGLFPSKSLAFHEWKKHGTCAELSPRAYLQLSQTLKNRFITPLPLQRLSKPLRVTATQLTQYIVKANPALNASAIAFSCKDGGRFLQEIYVCYDKTGSNAASCGTDVQRRSQRSCGQQDFLVRNIH